MKIAVLANCQGESVVACAQAMSPQHEFEFVSVTTLWSGECDLGAIFRDYDKVFAQNILRDQIPADAGDKTVLFPVLAFPAFHPDMTYLRGQRRDGDKVETLTNEMVMYHSSIVVTGFLSGLTVDEIVGLFRPETFAKLGYFDVWAQARKDLLAEGLASGMPLGALFERWARRGCFMYSMNHPQMFVLEDVTRELLTRSGLPVVTSNVSRYLEDRLRLMSIWPIYPAIAQRLGLHGDYTFVKGMLQGTMTLREFVQNSVDAYSAYDPSTLEATGFTIAEYRRKLGLGERSTGSGEAPRVPITGNPYKSALPNQFWKRSVAEVRPENLDPVMQPRFVVQPSDQIATAGSCFAQHIARVLSLSGYSYFVPEGIPEGLGLEEGRAQNYGVYSARYGNIYTVRQLRQLLERVEGTFVPEDDAWLDKNGRFVDPFRPQIQPGGFADEAALHRSREDHFAAVRRMLREMNVFVFTLGLTEGWRSRHDGAVFPLAPGVAGGQIDFDRYEFVNFTVDDVTEDLHAVIDRLSVLNPSCRVILTVSPVPLIATYEPRHALVATSYSKSVLRAAADAIYRAYDHVEYFPSYEIITGSYNRGAYFEDDLRNVREEGVSHVMRVFMERLTTSGSGQPLPQEHDVPPAAAARPKSSLFEIVCDEEAIAAL